MRTLNEEKRAAIDAVAKWFSATWEEGGGPADAYMKVEGKRVALDVAILKCTGLEKGNVAKPRLRFDKVVKKLMGRLQAACDEIVPDGMTVVLTVTAPIRLHSQTAALLEEKIQTLLGRRERGLDERETICGNGVMIRLLKGKSKRAPKMIGFVHNSDTDPVRLLDMTRELLKLVSPEAGRRASKVVGDRWFVLKGAAGRAWLEAYRYLYSQLGMPTDYAKILMVFGDGQVEALAG